MTDETANRIRLVWLLPLVALAIGYAAGRYRHAPEKPAAPESRNVATTLPSPKPSTRRPPVRTPPPASIPAMPVRDLPLAQSFDALAARARSGDADASMRLLREMRRCQERPMLEKIASSPEMRLQNAEELTAKTRDAHRAYIAEHERARIAARENLADSEVLCADVTPAQVATLGEWLERAADSGDPGAGLCYVMAATSDGYAPADRYSDEWVEWMKQYRAKANTYAERAFAAGYPTASSFLYYVAAGPYAEPATLIDHDLPTDYARAYALALLQSELIARNAIPIQLGDEDGWRESAAQLGAILDESAIARARQWADAEAARIAAVKMPDPPCVDRSDSQ